MSLQSVFIGRNISSETKSWLVNENVSFGEHAFIQIVLNEPDYLLFSACKNKPKQFVASSQWAAKWLVKYHSTIEFSNLDSVFCLSEKQKEICAAITNNILVAKHQNANSLAQLTLEKNNGEQVIYLQGNLSLNIFELKMKSLGQQFLQVEVYRNLPLQKKLENTFGVYLFFSPSGAQNFHDSGNQIPRSSTIVTIGKTTAKSCEKLFNREIFVSEKQDELAAVKFAAGLLQNSFIHLK
jgi:uroporphyrinogen-III synthase